MSVTGPSARPATPASALEVWRRKLLDLTRRNRLLDFKATRRTTIRVVGESPTELFRLLALEGRALGFLPGTKPLRRPPKAPPPGKEPIPEDETGPAPKAAQLEVVVASSRCPFCHDPVDAGEQAVCEACLAKHHAECWEELGACASCAARGALVKAPAPAATALTDDQDLTWRRVAREALPEAQRDLALQTDLDADELDQNLVAISRAASSALEEQGFNALFLALGFLEWTERGKDEKVLRAPVLLVPVELKRGSLKGRMRLAATDDDPLVNPALAFRLQQERGLTLPALPDDLEGWDPDDLFQQVAELASGQGDDATRRRPWRLVTDAALGLLSFTKLVMYEDLKQNEKSILAHPLARRLLGLGGAPAKPAPAASGPGPDKLSPPVPATAKPDSYAVLDADQSQREAVDAVLAGRDLVLEGPPGTGKSQTITNLIAEALGRGKTVLFVSEKMAALEVVQTRLEAAGLGPWVLELHSRKAHKRAVVEALRKTLEGAPPPPPPADAERTLEALTRASARLDAHAAELHAPFGGLARSPWSALEELQTLEDPALGLASALGAQLDPRPESTQPPVERWTAADLGARVDALDALGRRLDLLKLGGWDAVTAHPLFGVGRTSLDGAAEAELADAIEALQEQLLPELRAAAAALADAADVTPPATGDEGRAAIDLVTLLLDPACPEAAVLEGTAWDGARAAEEVLELRERVAQLRGQVAQTFGEKVWTTPDLLQLADTYEKTSAAWYRVFNPSFWGARGAVNAALRTDEPAPEPAAAARDLRVAARALELEGQLARRSAETAALFGKRWGTDASRADLEALGALVRRFRDHLRAGRVPAAVSERLRAGTWPKAERKVAQAASKRLGLALLGLQSGWTRLVKAATLDTVAALGAPLDRVAWREVDVELEAIVAGRGLLPDWVDLQRDLARARDLGLSPFVERALSHGRGKAEGSASLQRHPAVPPGRLAPLLRRAFLERWLDKAARERAAIKGFDAVEHERAVGALGKLEAERLAISRARLLGALAGKRPDASWAASEGSELGLLQREVRKKRAHLPVRQLLGKIPSALAALKPCLLMSPLSVAQLLDPAVHRFDLVVFDEASQIAPEDALGAIVRATQAVVVGDSRQLPPTSFFSSGAIAQAEPGGEASKAEPGTGDLESVLDECVVAGVEQRMLRWHYRSRHESLIAFSNSHIYDGRLVTFPSPAAPIGGQVASRPGSRLGVQHVLVQGAVYDRGASGKNLAEAEAVADAVVRHLRATPDRSLGVGAFSAAQQEAIQDALDARLRQPDAAGLEPLVAPDRAEHLFVKNLENLQGDERDVILISVGYGPDRTGKLSLTFGPLTQSGGERRLNVLVTRARESLVVFTSFPADAIDEARTSSAGVKLLKAFLLHAERASATAAPPPAAPPAPSPLLEALARTCASRGLTVARDVGASAARLDLAVTAPDGRQVLGVVVDGPRYATFPAARDRDRLLPAVLGDLGWRLHRVWSLDWQRRRSRVTDELLAAVDAALAAPPPATEPDPEPEPTGAPEEAPDPAPTPDDAPPAAAPVVVEVRRVGQGKAAPPPSGPEPRPASSGAASRSGVRPYQEVPVTRLGDASDLERAGKRLVELVRQVVQVEGPIHKDELERRALAHYDLTRSGKRGRAAVEQALAEAAGQGALRDDGAFLWPAGLDTDDARGVLPRDRSRAGPREPELIPPAELAAALLLVASKELRAPPDVLVSGAARVLGLPRAGAKLKGALQRALEGLVADGKLVAGEDGALSPRRA